MKKKQNVSGEERKVTAGVATPIEEPLLSPRRAFVLQFYPETDAERAHFVGRVEHVVSGQVAHFRSWDDLQAFIARVLMDRRA